MTLEERIRERAHRIWEAEGRPEGKEKEHWERARKELSDAEPKLAGGNNPLTAGTSPPDVLGVDDLGVPDNSIGDKDTRPATMPGKRLLP